MKSFKKIFSTVLCIVIIVCEVLVMPVSANNNTPVKIKIGKKSFKAVFYDNDTANALLEKTPVKIKMSELNGNEKYKYLKYELPTDEKKINKIKAGDIMLYGSDCLVLFYKSFKTKYKYTKVGRITNTKGLKKAVGKGKVKVKITKKKTGEKPTLVSDKSVDAVQPTATPGINMSGEKQKQLSLSIGDKKVRVDWLDNESVYALMELVKEQPITISMSMYGGFEQVGSIGKNLPRNDEQTETSAGDIVLYSGNQIVIFYGSNSWSYTRLGHIADKSSSDMEELLSNGNVNISISMEEK